MINEQDILNARILIVDDIEANISLLEEMLRDAGYLHLSSTMDPLAVCALHRANHYDLILLDLQMPEMDGFQVMAELNSIETNGYTPIIAITAQPDYKLRALSSGAKDFISKPFNLMEIKIRIHNMLEVRLLYKKLEESNQTLASLALHDPLTGLPNRRLLMDRLTSAIAHAHRSTGTMAVMYVDLDGFKHINDTLDHDTGDALLRLSATRMLAAVRQEDTVARMGGDEFVIVLWKLSHGEDVPSLAKKVIEAVSQPCNILGNSITISASIGIGIYPAHGEDAKILLNNADNALLHAKRTGKNRFQIAHAPREGLITQQSEI